MKALAILILSTGIVFSQTIPEGHFGYSEDCGDGDICATEMRVVYDSWHNAYFAIWQNSEGGMEPMFWTPMKVNGTSFSFKNSEGKVIKGKYSQNQIKLESGTVLKLMKK